MEFSIHTPARGATKVWSVAPGFTFFSIHTPARGATLNDFWFFCIGQFFNPHTREGCDIKV